MIGSHSLALAGPSLGLEHASQPLQVTVSQPLGPRMASSKWPIPSPILKSNPTSPIIPTMTLTFFPLWYLSQLVTIFTLQLKHVLTKKKTFTKTSALWRQRPGVSCPLQHLSLCPPCFWGPSVLMGNDRVKERSQLLRYLFSLDYLNNTHCRKKLKIHMSKRKKI